MFRIKLFGWLTDQSNARKQSSVRLFTVKQIHDMSLLNWGLEWHRVLLMSSTPRVCASNLSIPSSSQTLWKSASNSYLDNQTGLMMMMNSAATHKKSPVSGCSIYTVSAALPYSFTTSVKESYLHPYDQVGEEPCWDPRTSYKCMRHR